jgi:ABC-2 type transport system ATP-binding protein
MVEVYMTGAGWSSDVLFVEGLYKHFGTVKAVDGLTFGIRPGEIYGLLGPNGAGKTTTIKCVLGLLEMQQGKILVLNDDPLESPEKVKTNIGYVAEEPLLYGSLTPREMLNFIASVRGLEEERTTERARRLISSLDATKYYDSLMETLSRGNKQKIQLIAALLHDPRLLILDEPLSGLDAKASKVVKEILELHVEHGGSVLLSTHIMEQAQTLCDRIGVINRGRMVAEGTLDELREMEHAAGASLEDIFLRLTEQDKDVKDTIQRFRDVYKEQKN